MKPVAVEEFGGVTALKLDAQSDYPTWLYCYDGQLMELYCYYEERPGPEDGSPLMPLEDLDITLEDGLLTLRITQPGGETDTLLLSLGRQQGTLVDALFAEEDIIGVGGYTVCLE